MATTTTTSTLELQSFHNDGLFLSYCGISFVATLTIFRVLAPALSRYLVPTYTSLPEDKKVRWDTTVASQCYAVGVSVVTIYGFVANDRLYRDPIWGRWDAVVGLECGVSIGYFLAELVTMFLEPTHLFSVVFLFHHITALVTVFGVAASNVCAFFLFYRLLHELSNIFFNFIKFFTVLKVKKSSPIYVANGMAFTSIFFLTRIVLMPGYYYALFHSFWTVAVQPHIVAFLVPFICGVIIDIMNFYWFYQICRGFVTILRQLKDTTKAD